MPEGLWRGHVEASADDELPFDDRRFLAFSVAPPGACAGRGWRPWPSPVSSRKPTSSRPRCGWRRTGEHYAKTPFDPRTVELVGGTGLPDLEKTEAVVLANVEDARRRRT